MQEYFAFLTVQKPMIRQQYDGILNFNAVRKLNSKKLNIFPKFVHGACEGEKYPGLPLLQDIGRIFMGSRADNERHKSHKFN